MNFEINYRAELISQEYREYFRFSETKYYSENGIYYWFTFAASFGIWIF
jgi:hypothetical protein